MSEMLFQGDQIQSEPLELTTREKSERGDEPVNSPRPPPPSPPVVFDDQSSVGGGTSSVRSPFLFESSRGRSAPLEHLEAQGRFAPLEHLEAQVRSAPLKHLEAQGRSAPLKHLEAQGPHAPLEHLEAQGRLFFAGLHQRFLDYDSRSLPVHCVVETIWSVNGGNNGDAIPSRVEVDSYVIIPVATSIEDLVSVALHRLGYSKENALAAKGSLVIRNWKPLPFDKIAESPLMTVGEILGELTTLATLRIQIFRMKPTTLSEMKDKLLKLLLVQHHSILVASGCPLDENLVTQLVRGSVTDPEPSDEIRRKFETWWSVQQMRLARPHPPWYSPPPPPPMAKETPPLHPALQMVQNQHPTPKTRMRTSFDPELELPKLQQWFLENQHPSRQQIQQFVKELNSLESRRGRKLLDVNNVVYWFKNARAAQKRQEGRSIPPSAALQYKLMLNGYHSNSQSPSEGGAAKSPGSLNQDSAETLEPLLSPEASPVPEKSPLPSSEQNHDGNGADEGMDRMESQSQAHDSIIDSANNNNTTDKDEQAEMSQDEEEDEEEDYEKDYKVFVKGEGVQPGGQRSPSFPLVPNSMFSHSIMYMSQYFPGMNSSPGGLSSLADERRKRNRTFIDPVSEVPRLEQWFSINTHPSHALILKYTEDLNQMPYRQKFPPLEPKNVQFWFKNRRAKCKRLKMSLFDSGSNNYLQPNYPHHLANSLAGEPYQAH